MDASAVPVTFATLVRTQANFTKTVCAFEREIAKSLTADQIAQPTRAEVKRRFTLCVKIFMILVGDLKWGVDRALGRLGEYLRKEIDHTPWEPDRRTFWMPGDEGE